MLSLSRIRKRDSEHFEFQKQELVLTLLINKLRASRFTEA